MLTVTPSRPNPVTDESATWAVSSESPTAFSSRPVPAPVSMLVSVIASVPTTLSDTSRCTPSTPEFTTWAWSMVTPTVVSLFAVTKTPSTPLPSKTVPVIEMS